MVRTINVVKIDTRKKRVHVEVEPPEWARFIDWGRAKLKG